MSDRKHRLLTAFDELRAGNANVGVRELLDDFAWLFYGATGKTLHVLVAGFYLCRAMVAKRDFDVELFRCVQELAALDMEFVCNLHARLRVRPTWYLWRGADNSVKLAGKGY